MSVLVCKRGHWRIDSNKRKNGQCAPCHSLAIKRYKKKHLHPRVLVTHCKNGHELISVNLRTGRRECAVCHKNNQLNRSRAAGALPMRRLTREEKLLNRRRWESTRRARINNSFIEVVDPIIVFNRDGGICGICREPVSNKWEIDHIVPIARNGKHSYANTQVAHPTCNRKKWALTETNHEHSTNC